LDVYYCVLFGVGLGLGIGLDLVILVFVSWLVVMHTYLYYSFRCH